MERETKIPPAEKTVIISDVQLPLPTQALDMESDSPSVSSGVKEGEPEEFHNDTTVTDQSAGIFGGNGGIKRSAEDTQGGALAIHVADAGDKTERKTDETLSGLDTSERTSQLEAGYPSPPPEMSQAAEAAFPDSSTGNTGSAPSTNQISPEEPPLQPDPELETKEMGPSLSPYYLLGLPIDALHAIASFLSPKDFCNFGFCSKGATKVCSDVFRRVRMHGFRCATEVVTAWVSVYILWRLASRCLIELTFPLHRIFSNRN
jgi:hypothetical protein